MDIESVLKGHGLGIGGSNIKSIQRGQYILQSADKTVNLAISTVDLTKAIVLIHFNATLDSINPKMIDIQATITSTNILTLTRTLAGAGSSNGSVVSWQVIEFNNVKSLQRGVWTVSATGSIGISPVNINKTILLESHTSTGDNASDMFLSLYLASPTNILVTKGTSTYSYSMYWYAIEFN
ncbi:hypothetical protein LGL08_20295 [Clostridium estertheticum]|uniref:hypothetical protein n=1 Tax=Clostridium estertheticum TaxID=238834 RepID=UPI001CF17333|nr:hypothetical protein [Clostridium estertheticum]MCB2309047.1 hypothetical protein [Clostridium estertheticum]MCB2346819.1 hypothetical protein [Clostridium estertheticum]MCB2351869.1 hypothetical protein [Clostridium estertheticum]WAG48397.1 hypothetical protein LL127_23100 [Clostridium estertheticum]